MCAIPSHLMQFFFKLHTKNNAISLNRNIVFIICHKSLNAELSDKHNKVLLQKHLHVHIS